MDQIHCLNMDMDVNGQQIRNSAALRWDDACLTIKGSSASSSAATGRSWSARSKLSRGAWRERDGDEDGGRDGVCARHEP
jgi:hypothetical protein